jgi:hypothetical protein
MYRKRRRKLQKRRRATVIAAFAAVLVVAVGVPTFAFGADRVDNLLGGVSGGSGSTDSGSGATSTGGSVSDKAGVPPDNYVPPLHGTDPHGQGSIATVDLTPGDTNPYGSDPSTSDEEVVVGDANGTQDGSGYHGHVTLLWLFGQPVIDVTSNQGESNDGPFQPINDGLQQLCDGSGGQLCLKVLDMHSSSDANGSTNSFELLGAHLGGDQGLLVDVGTSNGNIQQSGDCQTAHGDSGVANIDAGGGPLADVGQSDSTSTACSGGSTQDQHSTLLALGGNEVLPGCGPDGPANTDLIPAEPLLSVLCNASDSNGSQTSAPYGVREALAVFALINEGIPGGALLRVTAGSSESHAVAPGVTTTENPPTGTQGTKGAGGKGGNGGNGNGGNGGNGGGAGAGGGGGAANQAAAGNGSLAFTGADLLVLGLIGGALILGGLALTTLAGRGHRQTV